MSESKLLFAVYFIFGARAPGGNMLKLKKNTDIWADLSPVTFNFRGKWTA